MVCIVNEVGPSSIAVENFCAADDPSVTFHLIVAKQMLCDAEEYVRRVYPEAKCTIYSLAQHAYEGWWSRYRALQCLLTKIQPTVIHVHHTYSALMAAIIRPFYCARVVLTAHGEYKRYSPTQKIIFAIAYLASDVIVANSHSTSKALPCIVPRRKVKVIYNGVNLDKLENAVDSTNKNLDNLFRVCSVARMVGVKDIVTTIRGFAKLVAARPMIKCELVLVGDGPERRSLEAEAHRLGIHQHVRFLGQVDRAIAYQVMVRADVFVVSSRYEGFCNAMVEAAAVGTTIVATSISTLKEVLGDGRARYIPTGDAEALGDVLIELEANPLLREMLAQSSMSHVRKKYALSMSASAYLKLYQELTYKGVLC